MRPSEVQIGETLRFVAGAVPAVPSRILEVGCGGGELSRRLQDLGHKVIAIDSSPASVEEARGRGVDARLANFLELDEAPFSALLFSRSLHHIRPVDAAVERAYQLLMPGGLLLVEDFAFGDAQEHTAVWFYRLLELLDDCGVLLPARGSFGRRLLESGGAFAMWREHAHHITPADEMLRALERRLELLEASPAPYLYRYVSAMLPDDDRGGLISARVLALEKATGAGAEPHLIGRRFVARRSGA